MIEFSVSKNQWSGILSVGNPNISVVSGIMSVVGIPLVPIAIGNSYPQPVPTTEEIQLLMYDGT